jgi:AmmeMemoRadiSam system protein B
MNQRTRSSVIAGTWYPGDPLKLQNTIQDYFDNIKIEPVRDKILGLISPHAGYIYSGQVAAYGFKQLIGKSYSVVVILAPMHQMIFGKYIVQTAQSYQTPLGEIHIHQEYLKRLSKHVELDFIEKESEHSLEIQLPFLQVALGNFSLLPIMIGYGDLSHCQDLIAALAEILKESSFVIIASTDLHHIPNYKEVKKKDREVVQAIKTYDLKLIKKTLSREGCTVCGRIPVFITMNVLKKLGATDVVVLNQTTSADVTGEKASGQYAVGYLSAAIVQK